MAEGKFLWNLFFFSTSVVWSEYVAYDCQHVQTNMFMFL